MQTLPVPALCGSGKLAPEGHGHYHCPHHPQYEGKSLPQGSLLGGRDPEAVGGSPVCVCAQLGEEACLLRDELQSHLTE